MFDKMEETIKGVVLFHETLKALNVKHEILAFNEDAFDSDDRKHLTSLMKLFIMIIQPWKSGPRIMSLHPQDDNRDGVAIRIASERLLRRSHNQRFDSIFRW